MPGSTPPKLPPDLTGDFGIAVVHMQVIQKLGWVFREQRAPEQGIDGQVEVVEGTRHTGQLLALQIKSGASWFNEPVEEGWVFRFDESHAQYWLGHALPIVIALVDITQTVYWQRVTHHTVESTGKNYKIIVPRGQVLDTARSEWALIASDLERKAEERYERNLEVLPPSVSSVLRRIETSSPTYAHLIAIHLAEGRRAPRLTLESLLVAAPHWVTATGSDGWCALANYGTEHELPDLAGKAFELAARTEDGNARLLILAGLKYIEAKPERARLLLQEALIDPASALIARLGLLLLDTGLDTALPLAVPPDLDLSGATAEGDTAVQAFLALQATRGRDDDETIVRYEKLLRLLPESSSAMTGLAQALGRRASSARSHPDDLENAKTWARKALDQRRRWDGDTTEALEILLRILSIQGDFDEVIRQAMSPPAGEARPHEARRSTSLTFAAQAAAFAGRRQLAQELVSQMPADEVGAALRAELPGSGSASPAEQVEAWHRALAEAINKQDAEAMVVAVQRLAGFGIDESARLSDAIARGFVPQRLADLAAARARAVSDLDGALPALRVLADSDVAAAEALVVLLAEAGRIDAAADAAAKAFERLRQPDLLVLRAAVLRDAQRTEAEAAALEALQDARIVGIQRARLHRTAAFAAGQREDWVSAEKHLSAALGAVAVPDADTVWNLVGVQLNQRRLDAAARTIEQYDPEVRSADEAREWFHAMTFRPWTEPIASRALTLANRFADNVKLAEALLGHVILTTRARNENSEEVKKEPSPSEIAPPASSAESQESDRRAVVSVDLRRQAFEALNSHIERHGTASAIRQMHGTTDELVEQLKVQLSQRDPEPLRQLLDQVHDGRLPLGLVAHAVGRSYALALAQRAAGLQVAVPIDDSTYDSELSAAKAALGGSVVVETSAILVGGVIDEFRRLRGHFTDLIMPTIARDDVVRAVVEVRGLGASTGSLGWDATEGKLIFFELTTGEKAAMYERAELLNLGSAMATPIHMPALGEGFEKFDLVEDGPWLAPISLARDRGLPLWSDDVALRSLARSVGVTSFCTLALVEVLVNLEIERIPTGSETESQTTETALVPLRRAVRRMLTEYIVDVPVDHDLLLAQIEEDRGIAGAGAAVLTRASWWHWHERPLEELRAVYNAVREHAPSALAAWQYAAMHGAGTAYRGDDYAASVMIGAVAVLGTEPEPTLESARVGLAQARLVAESLGVPDPAANVAVAVRVLDGAKLLRDAAGFLAELAKDPPGDDGTEPDIH